MKIQVRLFARARDLAGVDHFVLELPDGATIADLRRRIAADYPALAGLLARSALAVDKDFAADSQVLSANAEVALLPPVSGGSGIAKCAQPPTCQPGAPGERDCVSAPRSARRWRSGLVR